MCTPCHQLTIFFFVFFILFCSLTCFQLLFASTPSKRLIGQTRASRRRNKNRVFRLHFITCRCTGTPNRLRTCSSNCCSPTLRVAHALNAFYTQKEHADVPVVFKLQSQLPYDSTRPVFKVVTTPFIWKFTPPLLLYSHPQHNQPLLMW